VFSLRDIVWLVDPSRDRLDDLLFRMKDLASTLLPDVDREFRADTRHLSNRLSVDFRRQVFLIFKEAMHNVARHAGATRVTVEVVERDGRLRLSVADNGIGFDPLDGKNGSFGIASLRRRAESLGGTIEIRSQRAAGTTVRLDVPIP